MQINIHNYEEFAIDYLEGNLSAEGRGAMQLFLMQHPEIEAELAELEEDMGAVLLEVNEAIIFADKDQLLQLEEAPKVVPLLGTSTTTVRHNWKRYVLPIAATFCLFLIWQAFFQPMGEKEKIGEGLIKAEKKQGNEEKELQGAEIDWAKVDAVNNSGREQRLEEKDEVVVKVKNNEIKKLEDEIVHVVPVEGKHEKMEFEIKNNLKNKVKVASSNFSKVNQVSSNLTIVGEPSTKRNFGDTNQVHQQLIGQVPLNFTGAGEPYDERVLPKNRSKEDILSLENRRDDASTLALLPTQLSHITTQENIAMRIELEALDQSPLPANHYKKPTSNFMRNLKKAFLPQVLAQNEEDWMNENEGSDILVSINMKPGQHNLIKKIFKNNK